MTIKEIAELTGKNRTTVLRWVAKTPVQNAQGRLANAEKCGIPIDFSLEETLEILRAGGVSEGIMSLLRENAARRQAPGGECSMFDVLRIVVNTLESHEKRIDSLDGRVPRKAIPEAVYLLATKKGENPLMQAVSNFVESSGRSYQEAWQMIFDESYERLRINFQRRAQNDGVSPADYIEREGFMPAILMIAEDVFKRPRGNAFSERVEKSSQITARIIGGCKL